MMKRQKLMSYLAAASVAASVIATPFAAQAHRQWLLPSATVLSGTTPWVTVDAAVSNDLFYYEHNAMRLDNLVITAPDGSVIKPQNEAKGRYRSTFDVELTQPGTYRIASVNSGIMASYKQDGQNKRWRGTAENFAKEVPANAEELRVSETNGRVETFVTSGKPNDTALKTSGKGLELAAITHPNDLLSNTEAEFQLLLDGKPASGVDVDIVPGGIRYRDSLNDRKVTTDKDGKFKFSFAGPGYYWMEASVSDDKVSVKQAKQRRNSWVATFEVLPE